MIPVNLADKPVLLTGALGAIAEHLVKRLIQAGAIVIATDILSDEQANDFFRSWGIPLDRVVYRRMDVTAPDEVESVVAVVLEQFPSCELAIGHAGGCCLHRFANTPAATFDQIVRFNFLSQTYFARSVLGQWCRRGIAGHLVFTSSYVAQVPHAGISAYASAKAALENFARCLALEFAEQRIRVNCISPGNVAAGSSLKVYSEDASYRAFVDRVTPFGGRNSPQAIADAFLFLCSPLAAEWNAQVLHVDWGISLPKIG